jgi:hypothetical protein
MVGLMDERCFFSWESTDKNELSKLYAKKWYKSLSVRETINDV